MSSRLLFSLLLLATGLSAQAQQGSFRFEGTIIDSTTQRTLAAEIVVYGSIVPGEMSRLQTGRLGVFTVMAETAGPYRFVVEAPAYARREVKLTAPAPGTPVNFTVRLRPLDVGAVVGLQTIRFKKTKPELLPESYPELLRLVAIMNANPKLEIKLLGHTDNVGDPAKNQTLSEQRVQTVLTYLSRAGISATRLSGQGFGGTKPIASNDQEATRQLNRRVEFEIVKR